VATDVDEVVDVAEAADDGIGEGTADGPGPGAGGSAAAQPASAIAKGREGSRRIRANIGTSSVDDGARA
jgi:hypothetical protein